MIWILLLKVLTNEKRGLLTEVAFDRSPFKLFSLWFHTNRCKLHPVTPQRTLFLSFAINNCFRTSDEKLLAVLELVLGDFFTIIKPLSGTAPNVTIVFLFVWRIFVCASAIIAMTLKVTTAVLPIRWGTFTETPNIAWISPLFEKIYDGELILTVFSNIGEVYNTVVSIKFMMWKVCRSPILCRYLQTIIECK